MLWPDRPSLRAGTRDDFCRPPLFLKCRPPFPGEPGMTTPLVCRRPLGPAMATAAPGFTHARAAARPSHRTPGGKRPTGVRKVTPPEGRPDLARLCDLGQAPPSLEWGSLASPVRLSRFATPGGFQNPPFSRSFIKVAGLKLGIPAMKLTLAKRPCRLRCRPTKGLSTEKETKTMLNGLPESSTSYVGFCLHGGKG